MQMRLHTLALALLASGLLAGGPVRAQPLPSPAPPDTVEGRFPAPDGLSRLAVADGSFGAYLRRLPLLPGRPPVHLFDGREKGNQAAHVAVVDMDVGRRDLQQCADAVMRLWAEHMRAAGRQRELCFRAANGEMLRFFGPARGFRSYMDKVFAFANTASLKRQLVPVGDPLRVEPGDVFIQGATAAGFGHAVIVVDVAERAGGARAFLLAQSYMPAQEIHVLRNPRDPESPWYTPTADGSLETPEWTFGPRSLMRFEPGRC
jgi:hypothetical protein